MNVDELAWVLQGEAGMCGWIGLWAVAYVWGRNPVMYGHQSPSEQAKLVAKLYLDYPAWRTPDPTDGARFLLSKHDLRQARVQRLIGDKSRVFELKCKGGLAIYGYK